MTLPAESGSLALDFGGQPVKATPMIPPSFTCYLRSRRVEYLHLMAQTHTMCWEGLFVRGPAEGSTKRRAGRKRPYRRKGDTEVPEGTRGGRSSHELWAPFAGYALRL